MKRIHPTHAPALARQEAALLPAMRRGLPRNLLPPTPNLRFRPAVEEAPASAHQAEPVPRRRGSAAGRAILHAEGVSLPGVTPMSGIRLAPSWEEEWPQ